MGQYSVLGDLHTQYGNFALMYGLPIGRKFAVNIDFLYSNVINQEFDGIEIPMDDSDFFVSGAIFDYYITESFGVNVGTKKVFGLDDYESMELTLGGGLRW